jgi:hypothetical protein
VDANASSGSGNPSADAGADYTGSSSVSCGAASCAGANPACCIESGDDGSIEQCGTWNLNGGCQGLVETCDDGFDCAPGDVCCLTSDTPLASTFISYCLPTCKGYIYGFQLCHSDAECTSRTCIEQTCPSIGNGMVQACDLIPSCTATM